MDNREKIKNSGIMPHLGILVTTYCNLNCRDCADLIPKRERTEYKPEDIKRDLKKLLAEVSYIEEVLIIGGETLLYPYLEEVLKIFHDQPKIGKLIITTNGTITPRDELMRTLQKYQVLVRVSGYPDDVVPNRACTVEAYRKAQIPIEDLDQMNWADIGSEECRMRSSGELEQVFQTCSMKECVTLNPEGKLFYCSRQMAAYETDIYPPPGGMEYVDVRDCDDLQGKLETFYQLPYISTCDYCDGISCATSQMVSTAAQILKKEKFLELLEIYTVLKSGGYIAGQENRGMEIVLRFLKENIACLRSVIETGCVIDILREWSANANTKNNRFELEEAIKRLINALTRDYNFCFPEEAKNRPNQIRISIHPDERADIVFQEEEIQEAVRQKYPLDAIAYDKLFVEAKLSRLASEDIACVVSGLSYTQYGILEAGMPFNTVNLSITSQDIPHSVLIARRALTVNPNVQWVVMPMTYYQGCYDMSASSFELHRQVMGRINAPLLEHAKEPIGVVELQLYERIFRLDELRERRDEQIRDFLKYEEYFNRINPQGLTGGLKFDFKDLSQDERYVSARITAEHNERICTKEGYGKVLSYLVPFLDEMQKEGRKILIFVPPMTRYLYRAYHEELRWFYEENIVSILQKYENVIFLDLADDQRFADEDFCDFEHLSEQGAHKLTALLSAGMS